MSIKSLKEMKAASSKTTQKLAEKLDKESVGKFAPDERFWTLSKDKAGNGYAVIRFLPAIPGAEPEDLWTKVFSHGFQGKGGWLIENCPTTLEKNCPICEANSELWNTGKKELRAIVSLHRKRKLSYISNIFVVEDKEHPENEGKVFLFRYGVKLHDKIKAAMNPEQDEDEQPFNPFDFWEGANFKVKMKQVAGFNNYDDSKFMKQTELFGGDDAEIEKVWNQEYSLAEFVDPSQFLGYDELKAKFARVLGGGKSTISSEESGGSEETPFEATNEGDSGEASSTMDFFNRFAANGGSDDE